MTNKAQIKNPLKVELNQEWAKPKHIRLDKPVKPVRDYERIKQLHDLINAEKSSIKGSVAEKRSADKKQYIESMSVYAKLLHTWKMKQAEKARVRRQKRKLKK